MEVDSDNESVELISSSIGDTEKVTLNSLPEKSRKKYEAAYKLFLEWCADHNKTSFAENVLMDYFNEKSNKFKSSTLWTQYSMLRMTLSLNNDVDISKYIKLRAFLKRQSHGYRPKRSKTFTSNEINKFINEAPDTEYLLTKVALIMGLMGACRRHELHQMRTTHIKDLGSAVLVTIPDKRTKIARRFTITGHFYDIFKKYASLRPSHANDTCFFLNYQRGKCTIQRVGINKFGAMGKQIAKYLKLPNPESYTGHCFRRSSATVIVDADRGVTYLKKHASFPHAANVTETALTSSDSTNYALVFLKSDSEDPLHTDPSLQDEEEKEIKVEVQMGEDTEDVDETEPKVPENDEDVQSLVTEVKYLRNEVKRLNGNVTKLRQELLESKRNELRLEHVVKAVRIIVNQDIQTTHIKQENE